MTTTKIRPATLGLVFLLALGAAVTAAMLFIVLGAPQGGNAVPLAAMPGSEESAHLAPKNIESMVDRLAKRLEKEPDNAEGWLTLARSYAALGRFDDSTRAYGKAEAILPDRADVLADYADALAMAQGRKLAGEPEKLVQRALALDPKHAKALALAGTAAFERGDFKKARAYWNKALDSAPADAEFAASLRHSIADAEARLAETAPPAHKRNAQSNST